MAKLKRILIVLLVVVLLAGVGVFLYFYFTQGGSPPVVGGNGLSLYLNGTKIENGGSLGLLDSGQEFTVENAEKYDVQIYAYCTRAKSRTLGAISTGATSRRALTLRGRKRALQ